MHKNISNSKFWRLKLHYCKLTISFMPPENQTSARVSGSSYSGMLMRLPCGTRRARKCYTKRWLVWSKNAWRILYDQCQIARTILHCSRFWFKSYRDSKVSLHFRFVIKWQAYLGFTPFCPILTHYCPDFNPKTCKLTLFYQTDFLWKILALSRRMGCLSWSNSIPTGTLSPARRRLH